ncbi:MAG: histidine kinase [Eubacteriales bacterium]|nr:histidine kinase [Eubacteriales bacterium]
MKKRTPVLSVQYLLLLLLLLSTLPIFALALVNNRYAAQYTRTQLLQSYRDGMTLYLQVLENNYREIEMELGTLINQSLSDLYKSETDVGSNESLLAQQRLKALFSQNAIISSNMDAMFFYTPQTRRMIHVRYSSDITYPQTWAIRTKIAEMLDAGDASALLRWDIVLADHAYYLVRMQSVSDSYIGVYLRVDEQLADLRNRKSVSMDDVVFLDNTYRLVSGSLLGAPIEEPLTLAGGEYAQDGVSYYLVHVPLAKTGLILTSLIREDTLLAGYHNFRNFLMWSLIAMAALLPIVWVIVRRVFIRPLDRLVKAMRVVQTGDFSIRLPEETPAIEIQTIAHTFNVMANEVKELKISNYESRLEQQQARLQYYQLQIHPHFLTNTLNMIATLAVDGDCGRIQTLSRFLAEYFRYLFRNTGTFVPLRAETEHTSNYLSIQQMRYPDKLDVLIDVPDELSGCAVLPLLLQTFVENSVQYAVSMDSVTTLAVVAQPGEAGRVHISISDTGPGFNADWLARWDHDQLTDEERRHIGIANVRERLRLAYHGEADIRLRNAAEGGAVVDIWIPYRCGQTAIKGEEKA